MAISYVGSVSGETGNLTLTGVQEGDVCFLWLYRDGNTNGFPNPTTEWLLDGGASNNFQTGRLYTHVVTAGEGAAGSVTDNLLWTSITAATTVLMVAYRGVESIGVGAHTGAASTTITYPALTLSVTDGSSWVVGIAAHRATNTSLQTAPTGLTNRINLLDATDHIVVHDGARSSWSATDVSVGGTASGWRSATVELVAATGGGPPSETGSGSLTTTSLTAPSGASTASATASGSVAALSLSAPTGTSSTFVSVTATGAISTLTLSAPAAAAATVSVASGALDALALAAPTGVSAAVSEIATSGSFAPLFLSAPAGASTASATASGSVAALSLSAPTGTSSTAAETSATGAVAPLSLVAPLGATAVTTSVTGALATINLAAPTGTADTLAATTATGSLAEVSLTPPTGAATTVTLASGVIASVSLTTPNGTADSFVLVTADGSIAPLLLVAPTGSAGVDVVGQGAIGGVVLTAPRGRGFDPAEEGLAGPGVSVRTSELLARTRSVTTAARVRTQLSHALVRS